MSRIVTIRLASPPPVKVKLSQTITHTRLWDEEKLMGYLKAGLEPMLQQMIDDVTLEVLPARRGEISFSWKPEQADELREQIGELIGSVMEDIEVDEYLTP